MYQPTTMLGTTEGCEVNHGVPKETTTGPQVEDHPNEVCSVDPSILTNPPTELSIQAPPVGVVQGGPRSPTTGDDADVPWKCTSTTRTRDSTLFATQRESGATKSSPSFSIDTELDFASLAEKNRAKKNSLHDQCKAPTLTTTRVSNGLKAITVAAQRTASPNTGSQSPGTGSSNTVSVQSMFALADGTEVSSTCTARPLAHGSTFVAAQRGSVSTKESTSVATGNELEECLASGQKKLGHKKSLLDQCKAPTLGTTCALKGLKAVTFAAQSTASKCRSTGTADLVDPLYFVNAVTDQTTSSEASTVGAVVEGRQRPATSSHNARCSTVKMSGIASPVVVSGKTTGKSRGRGRRGGQGYAMGRSVGGLALWAWVAWVVPWCWLVWGGVEGVDGEPIPDCTPTAWNDRCGIRQAVDTYTTPTTIAKYGLIQDWNTSLVTDMSNVFYSSSSSSPLRSFNANISAWDVGQVTTMYSSTYTPPPPSPRLGLFLAASISPLLSVAALILFLNNALSFFSTHFYPWTFLCCCCGAVFYRARAFNGDLSTWQVGKVTDMIGSTYTLLGCFLFSLVLSVAALCNSIFEQCSLLFFFSNPFLSLDFSLLLLWCSVWLCCCLQW
jgi:hypothetical protein